MILIASKRVSSTTSFDEVRIVRGGGWYMLEETIWTAIRKCDHERIKEHSLGFRIILRKRAK